MKKIIHLFLVSSVLFFFSDSVAQITIDINPSFKHEVGGIDSMDRAKFINVHSDHPESDWSGWNFEGVADLRDTFLNGLDVYLGRNTGLISWQINQVAEDPTRPGFADPIDLANRGAQSKTNYANQPEIHPYEVRNDLIIAAQHRPYFPDGTPTTQGWSLASGTATGEYMGRYINEFHGGNGQPLPAYVEVMNEPLWEFVTNGPYSPAAIFEYHNEVADAIREQTTAVPIGGYCSAFPLFEKDNFQRWNDRQKLFMDMSGDKMDYWAIHLYDFNSLSSGQVRLRRGGNNEATFDMIEHYSYLTQDEVKPFLISEFGGRALNLEPDPWTPYRDWMSIKSIPSMWLSFMDRPDLILKAIPFIPIKAEWGTQTNPYPWRLMRKDKEASGQAGDYWVYTDMVKIFQQWSEVKGTRIDIRSTDPDIQNVAYVDNEKLHVALVNLGFDSQTIDLNVAELTGNTIENIDVKHLYLDGEAPVLSETNYSDLPSFELEPEASAIITYTYANDLTIDQTSNEIKYYAEEHLTPIVAFGEQVFHINGVEKSEYGEAYLRIGMGRDHGKSLTPIVKVNGQEIYVSDEYMGDDQSSRKRWFGLKEIRIPYYHLQEDNEISVRFDDASGHISSMSIRHFEHSEPLVRSTDEAVLGIALNPANVELEVADIFQFIATISPLSATNQTVTWTSSNETVATVDEFGNITALQIGSATITVITEEDGLTASSTVEVVDEILPTAVTGIEVLPETYELAIQELLLMTANIAPENATNQNITWQSSNESIATVDVNGVVTAISIGVTEITGTTEDGGLSDIGIITVFANYENELSCALLPSEMESNSQYQFDVEYTAANAFDLAIELKDVSNNWVGEGRVTLQPGTGVATVTVNCVSTMDWTTPIFPDPGIGYTLFGWIRDVGGDWTTNTFGCSKNNITILGGSNTETPNELTAISIYPNPTDNKLFLDLPNLKTKAKITAYDILGKLILENQLTKQNSQLDMGAFPSGIYLIKIETEDASVTNRIVVE